MPLGKMNPSPAEFDRQIKTTKHTNDDTTPASPKPSIEDRTTEIVAENGGALESKPW